MNKLTVIGKNKTIACPTLKKVDGTFVVLEDTTLLCELKNCEETLHFQVKNGASFTLTILGENSKLALRYDLLEGSSVTVDHLSKDDDVTMEVELGSKSCFSCFYRTLATRSHHLIETIRHIGNESKSTLINHGVNLKGEALRFEVNGVVPKKVLDCVSRQDNQIIELEKGTSTILPNLLIEEHQVEASHSAYIGTFGEEELFYLSSRGIAKNEAYRLLLHGFFLGEKWNEEWRERYLNDL